MVHCLQNSRRESVDLGLHSHLTDKTSLEFSVNKNDNLRNEYLASGARGEDAYKTDSVRAVLTTDNDSGIMKADIYYTNFIQDYYSGGSFSVDTDLLSVKLSDIIEYRDNHIFRLEAGYREANNVFNDNVEMKYEIYSANALWNYRVSKNLTTNAAFRYDYFKLSPNGSNVAKADFAGYPIAELGYSDDDYNQVREEEGANIGVVYTLSKGEILRASFATGADLPSFTDFSVQAGNNPSTVRYIGNPYVETSVVTNYELSYEKKIKELEGSLKATAFYQETEEMQGFGDQLVNDNGVLFSIIGNLGDSRALGFELSLDGKYKENWNWGVNYSYIDIDDDLRNMSGGDYYSFVEYEDSNSEHTANLTAGYEADNWNANLSLQYVSGHSSLELDPDTGIYSKQEADGEFILNAHYSYDVTDNISWSISGQNMLGDTEQFADKNAEPLYWTSMTVKF